ncbi:MAG: aspartate carbamoyltransferase catalytic subunit [Chloroherpetonaceae bacterium]|nr:aspartate carbamoyltransferase catalytic subunit [Chloroherpetonaceae bacterium]
MNHLLGLRGEKKENIQKILDLAKVYVPSNPDDTPTNYKILAGHTIVLAFFENSTRTRISFDLAARRLGAGVINFSSSGTSVQKGETLADTIFTLQSMRVSAFVVRHSDSGTAEILSRLTHKPILNAGDGMHEHPTQALLDMLTLEQSFGKLEGIRVLILGDILHSRVARSNIFGLTTMGAKVGVCAPPTFLPVGIETWGNEENPIEIFTDVKKAVKWCDAVIVLRLQLEREAAGYIPSIREYRNFFSLTDDALVAASREVFVMHPGPVNREIEISGTVADRVDIDAPIGGLSGSLILKQVSNGVAVRMAALQLLLSPNTMN